MVIKVAVDAGKCQGHARCAVIAPDVFDIDDDGYSKVLLDLVPPELEEITRRAADNCPEHAVIITEA